MEFIVGEINAPKKIDFNFENLKIELSQKLKYYNSLVVTEDSIKKARADKAALNNLKKALNDKKIEVKKQYLAPYMEFEEKVKELMSMIDEPILAIDGQVKVFDTQKSEQKKKKIEDIYGDIFKEYKDVVPLARIYNSRWENVTYKTKEIYTEMLETYNKLTEGLKAIEATGTKYKPQITDKFLQTLDLALAFNEKIRLEEQEERLKDKPYIFKSTEQRFEESPPQEVQRTELIRTIDFRVWATPSQLAELKDFLNKNRIKYGKVE